MSLAKIEHFLETNGWTRQVAGKDDFNAALLAINEMCLANRGIIINGEYGVGKTALAKVICRAFGGAFSIRLGLSEDRAKLTASWQEYYCANPFAQNVFLDDLGTEPQVNEYGVRFEQVADFITTYHETHSLGTRLIVTTNLTTQELDDRYGGRVLSRLKDLVIPLRLSGSDKRHWLLPKGGAL